MASGHDQRRKQGAASPDRDKVGKKPDEEEELERLEEGQDISAEQAQHLQPQLGNQAVQALMARAGGGRGSASGGVEIEQEEDEVVEVEEEGPELEAPEHGGGSGGGGGDPAGGGGDPWDIGLLFGGDDDDDNPLAPANRRGIANVRRQFGGTTMREEAEDLGLLTNDDLAPVDELLPPPPSLRDEWRLGDAVYAAVEPALQDPRSIGRTAWSPEDLVDRTGVGDPIGRPAQIGRFLAEAAAQARARSLARVLGGPAAALLTPVGGHAGAVARLASLAVCCEVLEGDGRVTDRGVAVALVRDAWPVAVNAARTAAANRRLHAPEIARIAIETDGMDASEPDDPRPLPRPSRLGGRGLEIAVPAGYVPPIPSLTHADAHPSPADPSSPADDEALATIDAMLARLMGQDDTTALPSDPVLDWHTLEPVLAAANGLINAMGRAQVELAAAALAVRRVRGDAPIRQILVHGDKALRALARDVVGIGEALKRAEGEPIALLGDLPEHSVAQLREAASGLVELRRWAFETLAGAMDA